MRLLALRSWLVFAIIVGAFLIPNNLISQARQDTTSAPRKAGVEEMTGADFTALLKQIWSFLKSETESSLESTAAKGEFETSAEFERRVTDARRQYFGKILKYKEDQKLDKNSYWIPFQVSLKTYDADAQIYHVQSVGTIEAPYNIPAVQCEVPENPYLSLADSIKMGYRTSILYLKIRPDFKWSVTPEVARAAKTDEDGIAFRVRVTIDIKSSDATKQGILKIVPKEIELTHTKTHQVYWTRTL